MWPVRSILLVGVLTACASMPAASVSRPVARRLPGATRWESQRVGPAQVFYQAGTPAARQARALADSVRVAYAHDWSLLGQPRIVRPLELVFVQSPDEVRQLAGRAATGLALPATQQAFFVVTATRLPALRHELMHLLAYQAWGPPAAPGTWLVEGLAIYADGAQCRHVPLLSLAASLREANQLLPVPTLATQFDTVYDVRAYLEAGSVVEFVYEHYGRRQLEALWHHGLVPGDSVLAAWYAAVGAAPAPAWTPTLAAITGAGCD